MLIELLYLADRVDCIRDICGFLCVISAVVIIFGAGFFIEGTQNEDEQEYKVGKCILSFSIPLFIILFCISMFVPSSKFMYQAIGLHIGKQAIQSPSVDIKLQKISEIVDLKLDDMIKKMK
jgi:hypothetical protein